jgi:hypothetical protein
MKAPSMGSGKPHYKRRSTMARVRTYAEIVNGWDELLTAMEQNNGDLTLLDIPRQRLEGIRDQIKGFAVEQATAAASRQVATKRVEFLLAHGSKLATLLRVSIREHYGNRNEKIAEFGIRPLHTGQASAAVVNPLPQPE